MSQDVGDSIGAEAERLQAAREQSMPVLRDQCPSLDSMKSNGYRGSCKALSEVSILPFPKLVI
jgi:hypothetical protein